MSIAELADWRTARTVRMRRGWAAWPLLDAITCGLTLLGAVLGGAGLEDDVNRGRTAHSSSIDRRLRSRRGGTWRA